MKLDDINDALHTSFDSEDYDSIGGLMIEKLDRLPFNRESVTLEDGTVLTARGVQQHRRLCVEKISVLPDGRIPEVKMTSQGIGEPFGPGEKIMGYQACEVHGGCYIDVDSTFGEKLTALAASTSAVFRYVKKDSPWTGIDLTAAGSGTLRILLDGKEAGTLQISGTPGTFAQVSGTLQMEGGEQELVLAVDQAENLEIAEVTLH